MFIRSLLIKAFSQVSRIARQTPLIRLKWLGHFHNWLYGLFSKSQMIQIEGLVFEVDPRDSIIAKKLELYGSYEHYIGKLLLSLALPGSTVIDVGANIGLHTLPLARRVGPTANVIAFEPDPENFQILSRNIIANEINNVRTYNVGLSTEKRRALLYQSSVNRGGLSLQQKNVDPSGQKNQPVEIQLEVGDVYLEDISPSISLIKIDVEGAEPAVFHGMKNTLEKNPQAKVVFEFCPQYINNFGVNPLAFLKKLLGDGFRLSLVDEKTRSVVSMNENEIMKRAESSEGMINLLAEKKVVNR